MSWNGVPNSRREDRGDESAFPEYTMLSTHIHQVEQVPLRRGCGYPPSETGAGDGLLCSPGVVLATANSLVDRFATHLGNIEEAFVRAPAELQQQLEEAKQQVGTLTHVVGGQCTCHALCPISFACTGCVFKIPDPDREDEIIEQENWAFVRLEQVKRREVGPEIVKMERSPSALHGRTRRNAAHSAHIERMNCMSHPSRSNETNDEPKLPHPWLQKHYQEKRERTVRLVKADRRSTRERGTSSDH